MTREPPDIRPATDEDLVGVLRVLDGGLLETDAETIRRRIAGDRAGSVLVADVAGRVVGAVVLGERPAWVAEMVEPGGPTDGAHVDAIAVGRSRRGQGVGTALVRTAGASVEGSLTADFAESVRPFYESLGCRIESVGDDREPGPNTAGSRLVARVKFPRTGPTPSGDGRLEE